MSTQTAPKARTCGYHGGRTKAGLPCCRPAGWGTEREGRCRDHPGHPGRVVGEIEGDGPPPPPDHLSRSSAAVWDALMGELAFTPAELALLEEGLSARDRAITCREIIREEGVVAVNPDSGNPKRHPACTELDKATSQFRQIFRQLQIAPEAIT